MAPFCLPQLGKWLTRSKNRVVTVFRRLCDLLRDKDPPILEVAPFRLLDLPVLPLRRCLMHPDFVVVPFCSQRAYRIFKSMHLPIVYIAVSHTPDDRGVAVAYKLKNEDVPTAKFIPARNTDSMTLMDCVELVDETAARYSDLFRIPITVLLVDPASVPNFEDYLSSWIENLQTLVVPESSDLSYEQFAFLVEHTPEKAVLGVKCFVPVPIVDENDQLVYPRIHFRMKKIFLHDSEWITGDNFEISANCESLTLHRAAASTLRAVSKMIKDWQRGMYPKMSMIHLAQPRYNISPEQVISDPPAVWTNEAPQKIVQWTGSLTALFQARCLVLKRHDGMEAVAMYQIGQEDKYFVFRVINF